MLKIARWAVFFKPDQWRLHPKDESTASKCESAHQLERSLQWQMTALLLTFPPGWKLYSVIAGQVTHTEYRTTRFRKFRPCSTVDSRDRDKDTKTKQRTSPKSRFVNENQSHVLLKWNFARLRLSCLETKTDKDREVRLRQSGQCRGGLVDIYLTKDVVEGAARQEGKKEDTRTCRGSVW